MCSQVHTSSPGQSGRRPRSFSLRQPPFAADKPVEPQCHADHMLLRACDPDSAKRYFAAHLLCLLAIAACETVRAELHLCAMEMCSPVPASPQPYMYSTNIKHSWPKLRALRVDAWSHHASRCSLGSACGIRRMSQQQYPTCGGSLCWGTHVNCALHVMRSRCRTRPQLLRLAAVEALRQDMRF